MLIDNAHLNGSELRDQVIVVTGAGQGIGKATALILAQLGARVVIAEINDTGLETERLIREAGGQALFVKTDVADPHSMEQLRDRVQAAFGPVDVLVNNAEATVMKLTVDHSLEEWERVFAVNLRGAFLGIKLFLPEMLQRKTGTIITFESRKACPSCRRTSLRKWDCARWLYRWRRKWATTAACPCFVSAQAWSTRRRSPSPRKRSASSITSRRRISSSRARPAANSSLLICAPPAWSARFCTLANFTAKAMWAICWDCPNWDWIRRVSRGQRPRPNRSFLRLLSQPIELADKPRQQAIDLNRQAGSDRARQSERVRRISACSSGPSSSECFSKALA